MIATGGLTIEASREAGTYVLRLEGELNRNCCVDAELAFELAARSDAAQILLDIDGLEVIDSRGLRTIFNFSREQSEKAGRLRITPGARSSSSGRAHAARLRLVEQRRSQPAGAARQRQLD